MSPRPSVFVCQLEANHPFVHLEEFQALLKARADIDMFWEGETRTGKIPKLSEKLSKAQFLFIPDDNLLNSYQNIELIQNEVLLRHKSALLFSNSSTADQTRRLNNFLSAFNVVITDAKVYDEKHAVMKYNRAIRFSKDEDCLHNSSIFEGVDSLVISEPLALLVGSPSLTLIDCAETAYTIRDDLLYILKGTEIKIGAYYSEHGKLIVMDPSPFMDPVRNISGYEHPGIMKGRRFVENALEWLIS